MWRWGETSLTNPAPSSIRNWFDSSGVAVLESNQPRPVINPQPHSQDKSQSSESNQPRPVINPQPGKEGLSVLA